GIEKELGQESTGEAARIDKSNPGGEVVIEKIDEVCGKTWISGEAISHGSRGEDLRLTSQLEVRIPIKPVGPERGGFPPDPEVQGQIRFRAPTVFPIDPNVKVPQIKG